MNVYGNLNTKHVTYFCRSIEKKTCKFQTLWRFEIYDVWQHVTRTRQIRTENKLNCILT